MVMLFLGCSGKLNNMADTVKSREEAEGRLVEAQAVEADERQGKMKRESILSWRSFSPRFLSSVWNGMNLLHFRGSIGRPDTASSGLGC